MLFSQQVTFIYTTDLAAGSAFLSEKLGLELALNQNDTCHIYKVTDTSFLGICTNRAPSENPSVTYSFVSDDVDGAYEALRSRGVTFEAPPAYSERFKVYSAFFRGPENYRFELQAFRDPDWKSPTRSKAPYED